MNYSTSGLRNVEGLQEVHEAYQIVLKILLASKDRFKKKSKVNPRLNIQQIQINFQILLGYCPDHKNVQDDDSRKNLRKKKTTTS